LPTSAEVLSYFKHRRAALLGGAVAALLAIGAVLALLTVGQRPGDVAHPNIAFIPAPVNPPPPLPHSDWPVYGLFADRTAYLPSTLAPPFRRLWAFDGGSLLEFAPVLAQGKLYLVNNEGLGEAISAATGKVLWRRRIGSLSASSFGYWDGRLYIIPLSGSRDRTLYRSVHVTSLEAATGRVLWSRPVSSGAESGPMVVGGRLYFGAEDGTAHALDARSGAPLWSYHAGGKIKSALAYAAGRLYFGDYSGELTAVRASDGRRVWSAHTQGLGFLQSGTFYATPAVAFGRVYVGNTDDKVYSFSAATGQLAWTHSTGGYVYGSAAVAAVPGTPPTVYVGSYDGHFYALDARSGRPRWIFNAGARISGAGSVVGHVVYFATLANKVFGVDVRSGRQVFELNDGSFNPVISDGRRLYVTGYAMQYAYVPVASLPPRPARAAPRPARAAPSPRARRRRP